MKSAYEHFDRLNRQLAEADQLRARQQFREAAAVYQTVVDEAEGAYAQRQV